MVTKEKKSFTKLLSSPRPEAVEMQPFLEQYLTEVQELNLSYYWDLRLPELSAYQTLKQQDAAYKGRLVLATVEALRSLSNNYETLYQLEALLKQLLRLTLSISSEGFLQLLKLYGISEQAKEQEVETALNKFPVLLRWSDKSGQNRVLSFLRHERQPSAC
ncbi:hypothetical protein H8B15_08120 [Hymenobacter sp. BT507]|uniref:Uncharacterized protein n=2 Tax=Hymenobacter citatus TaxID=2763506 RepID=A0ABR7MIK3_9BACT|nr:hypothetical protein [Hymenobacter citatus]